MAGPFVSSEPKAEPTGGIKIDHDIMPPLRKTGGGRGSKYPWEKLNVGDSFFIEGKKEASLRSSARRWAKGNAPDQKHTAAEVVENGVAGARIWRTA